MENKTAVCLLSGGQDSTTCLAWAKTQFTRVIALSVFYGQRHAAELESAKRVAEALGAEWLTLSVPAEELVSSALTDSSSELRADGGIEDDHVQGGLPTSFVPGRNMLLLTLASMVAVKNGARDIVAGFCQADYSGYPDCRREFVSVAEQALSLAMPSSCRPLSVHTPLMYLSKAESVRYARELPGAWDALSLSLTCYEGKRPGCGACPACTLRAKGFAEAGHADPACASI